MNTPFEIGKTYSAILLSTFNNHFIKVRATLDNSSEGYLFECLMQSLGYFGSLLTPRQSEH